MYSCLPRRSGRSYGVVKFSPSLNLNKIEHFSKVSSCGEHVCKIIILYSDLRYKSIKSNAFIRKTQYVLFFSYYDEGLTFGPFEENLPRSSQTLLTHSQCSLISTPVSLYIVWLILIQKYKKDVASFENHHYEQSQDFQYSS